MPNSGQLCVLLLALSALHAAAIAPDPCPNPVQFEYGTGCVCTASSCGTYPDSSPPSTDQALIVTSSKDGGFLQSKLVPISTDAPASAQMQINADTREQLQTILGFGGAITDASALAYDTLEPAAAAELISQFFSQANFSFARVPMNAADFSRMNYALASKPNASDFCLRDDRTPDGTPPKCGDDYKLPPLQAAMEANPLLKVFVSTWSAHPAFKEQNFECTVVDGMNYCTPSEQPAMECNTTVANPDTCDSTNKQGVPCPTVPPTHVVPKAVGVDNDTPIKNADGNCANTGFVKDQASWALQFKKFIDAYQNASVPIWGVTAQNEPLTQTGMWGSNFYTAQNEIDFIVNHLSPTLRRAYPHIKIMSHDDQMPALGDRGLQVATDAGDHIDGIAFHWYDALEGTYEDGKPQSPLGLPHWIVSNKVNGGANVKTTYDALNGSKFLLMTEACSGYSLSTSWVGPRHGEWGYGYSTGHDIMWQLKNRAAGWVYWNLILDEVGGPNLAGNYVDSPTWKYNSSAFVQNPSFFFMMHYSRFVPPGSVVIDASVTCGARHKEYCQFVAFRVPNGNVVVVMTNDEITVGPIAGTSVGPILTPHLAKGQGSITVGAKTLSWSVQVTCKGKDKPVYVEGTLPWKAIQTVVIPC